MAKILLLAASPAEPVRWLVERYARELARVMRATSFASHLEVSFDASGAPGAPRATVGWQRPAVVHFIGRGEGRGEVSLSDVSGPIEIDRALDPFRRTAGVVRCVILDGCWSPALGGALATVVDCVVAVPSAIDDDSSMAFADAFYRALAFGMNAAKAYELATNQLEQRRPVQASALRLLFRAGVDPTQVLLPPASSTSAPISSNPRPMPQPPPSSRGSLPRPPPPPPSHPAQPPPSYPVQPASYPMQPPPYPVQPPPHHPGQPPSHRPPVSHPAPRRSYPPQTPAPSSQPLRPLPPSNPPAHTSSPPASRPGPAAVPYALMRPLPKPSTLLDQPAQAVKLLDTVPSPAPWREVAVVPFAAGVRKPLDPGSILGAARSSQPMHRSGAWAGHPFFPWLDLGPRPDATTQGLLWRFSGSRGFDGIFTIGFDGSFVQRELVRELSHPNPAHGAGVGLFTSLDTVAGALLFARRLAAQFPEYGRAWVVLRVGLIERVRLLLDFEDAPVSGGPASKPPTSGARESVVGAGGYFSPQLSNPELSHFCAVLGAELASWFDWTWEPVSASAEIAARLAAAVED